MAFYQNSPVLSILVAVTFFYANTPCWHQWARSGIITSCQSLSPNLEEGRVMAEVEIGKVTHYFSKIGVVAIAITQDVLRVGDTIHVKGHTSDFTQKIDSMQIDNKSVAEAAVGQSVGLRAKDHAREHDQVFKVVE